jgi:hypothetical protein
MLEFAGALEPEWLQANPRVVPDLVRAMPSFLREDEPGRFLLRAPESDHDWDADVWLWLTDTGLQVAVAALTSAFRADLQALADELHRLTGFELFDDDGRPAEFD